MLIFLNLRCENNDERKVFEILKKSSVSPFRNVFLYVYCEKKRNPDYGNALLQMRSFHFSLMQFSFIVITFQTSFFQY